MAKRATHTTLLVALATVVAQLIVALVATVSVHPPVLPLPTPTTCDSTWAVASFGERH